MESATQGILSEANFAAGADSPHNWNLQMSLAESLKMLHQDRYLPQEVATHVSMQMRQARDRAGRLIESLGKDVDLLREHLLQLRELLTPTHFKKDELLQSGAPLGSAARWPWPLGSLAASALALLH